MKPLRILAFLIVIGTVLTATYMHESYHRYDLVTAGGRKRRERRKPRRNR
jgi:hypothetical protein